MIDFGIRLGMARSRRRKLLQVLSIGIFLLPACSAGPTNAHIYQRPLELDDGLEIGALEEANIDPAKIESAVTEIGEGKYGEVHSLLIYQAGRLVVEEYFPGHDYQWDGADFHGDLVQWDIETEHNIHSVGKSITSACVGIAVDRGFIESVDQSIFDYLPAYQYLGTGGKGDITIEHLLTMTSGLEWDEWGSSYADVENDVIALWIDCEDPTACILNRPLVSQPGTDFNYSGGNMILLGEIVKNASGQDIEAFSGEYLFEPLGIEAPSWRWIEGSEVIYAGGDQRLTPREMLKFGVLFLDNGVWNEKRIISEGWVNHSATPYSGPDNTWFNSFLRPIPPGDNTLGQRGYAYGWWTHEFLNGDKKTSAYWAFGWGGQRIAILPEQDAVVVLTGGNYTSADLTAKILTDRVLPAFRQ